MGLAKDVHLRVAGRSILFKVLRLESAIKGA